MIRLLFLFVCVLFAGCASQQHLLTDAELIAVRDAPAVAPKFSPPVVEPFTLSNGVKVYFAHDDEIPMFHCSLIFPRGSLERVASEQAQYSALDSQMRTGGVEGLSSDDVDVALQKLSASIGVSIGSEASSVSFGGLTPDFETISALAKRVWQTPTFNEDRLMLWKLQMNEGIARRKESPEGIAAIAFSQALYRGSVLAPPISRQQVDQLTKQDLIELHRKIFNPSGMVILLSGAIDKEYAINSLEALLADHSNNFNLPIKTFAGAPARDISALKVKPGIYFIEKPFQQASVYLGILGPKRFTPDYPAIDVFNGVLGANGEFSSLLVQEVRSRLGLSYSIIGGVFRDEPIGRSFIGLQTKNESAAKALGASIKTVDAINQGRFSPQLLNDVKTAASNSYVFGFDSLGAVAGRRVYQDLIGYPSDYDQTYLAKISAVTLDEIKQVAAKYWKLENAIIIVVGDSRARQSLKEGVAKRWLPNLPIKELTFDEQLHGL